MCSCTLFRAATAPWWTRRVLTNWFYLSFLYRGNTSGSPTLKRWVLRVIQICGCIGCLSASELTNHYKPWASSRSPVKNWNLCSKGEGNGKEHCGVQCTGGRASILSQIAEICNPVVLHSTLAAWAQGAGLTWTLSWSFKCLQVCKTAWIFLTINMPDSWPYMLLCPNLQHCHCVFYLYTKAPLQRAYRINGVPLGNNSGWWDDRKRSQKPVLPLYPRLNIPSNLSRALSCLRLSGHNFLVQRMRHDRNWRPYELRICGRCDWHTIQDSWWGTHFVGLSAWTSSQTSHTATVYLPTSVWGWPSSFEDLYEPTWYFGVASFVAKCLALFPWFLSLAFLVWLQAFSQPTSPRYNEVTMENVAAPVRTRGSSPSGDTPGAKQRNITSKEGVNGAKH